MIKKMRQRRLSSINRLEILSYPRLRREIVRFLNLS